MPQAKNVNNIVKHCTAGFGLIPAIQNHWKRLGWRTGGYLAIIYPDGTIWWLMADGWNYTTDVSKADFTKVTNGVKGFNKWIMNYAYVGGVERVGNIFKAKDTQTDAQKKSEQIVIQTFIKWLKDNGKDITKNLGLVGHYDFSKDTNNNGVIESWERIKECPSVVVIGTNEHYLYSSKDRYNKLPTEK